MNHLEELSKGKDLNKLDAAFLGGKGNLQKWITAGQVPATYVNTVSNIFHVSPAVIVGKTIVPVPSKPTPDISLETIKEAFTIEELRVMLDGAGVSYSKKLKETGLAKLVMQHKLYLDNL